jgi:hypothetical protein
MRFRFILQSVGVGVLVALAFGAGVFLLFPRTAAVTAFIAPGIPLAGFFGRFLPGGFAYSLHPEGGAPSFLALVLIFALLFWALVAAGLYVIWYRLRRTRAA